MEPIKNVDNSSMPGDMKARVIALLTGAALIAVAVVIRVWLAATGGYSEGGLALLFRIGSIIALVAGLLLVGAAVAWPMQKRENR